MPLPPAAMEQAGLHELDVTSFNLWDAPMVAAVRLQRMHALAHFLQERGGNVWVCQELFHDDTLAIVGDAARKAGLHHVVRFESGADLPNCASGCGVVIFSKWPVVESLFFRWGTLSAVSAWFASRKLPATLGVARAAGSLSMAAPGTCTDGTGMQARVLDCVVC